MTAHWEPVANPAEILPPLARHETRRITVERDAHGGQVVFDQRAADGATLVLRGDFRLLAIPIGAVPRG
jgi:hypothetical protein